MTCQWCVHYRRRSVLASRGTVSAVCAWKDGDGSVIGSRGLMSRCPGFCPKRICTTCEFRCGIEEKKENSLDPPCRKWRLRSLTTWGGKRDRGYASPGLLSETGYGSSASQSSDPADTSSCADA